MRRIAFPIMVGAAMALAAPAAAQRDLGDIVGGVAQSLIQQELDRNAWAAAQQTNSVRGYRNYLAQFPRGIFRAEAERALARLGSPVGDPPPVIQPGAGSAAQVEASLGLTRTQRATIQRQLTSLGYNTGVADGLWGSNTRNAIGRWQSANRATATGYVTAQQVRLIGQQAGSVTVPTEPGDTASDARVEERLLGLTSSERREIQRRLTALGYRTGGVDGVFGPATRRALASWQSDEGLRATGYITADQLRELRRQTAA